MKQWRTNGKNFHLKSAVVETNIAKSPGYFPKLFDCKRNKYLVILKMFAKNFMKIEATF